MELGHLHANKEECSICNLCYTYGYFNRGRCARNSHIISRFQGCIWENNASILLEYCPYDCTIELQDGAQPLFGPIYNLSQTKLIVLCEYIDENLSKKFIRHSKSLARASILFIKKNDESLRMYMDYCGLNKITKRNSYPLPLISRLLE